MLGRQERWREDLFVAAPLRDLVPDDHILKRVDKVLDLSWPREAVRDLYDEGQGRPGVDPAAAVRLMLAGLFQGRVPCLHGRSPGRHVFPDVNMLTRDLVA